MLKQKKAEMGVGTLIVFIAMLLVAAVAAGVLIQTSSSLQERALSTGQQAQDQISTNAQVDEVSATDGKDAEITDFEQLIKLSPGSRPIKLSETMFTFNTQDETATLHYRGVGSECSQGNEDGYNTWMEEEYENVTATSTEPITLENDLDDDREDDEMYVDGDELIIELSTEGQFNVSANETNSLENETDKFAEVEVGEISGGTAEDVVITPHRLGEGYFAAVYEQTGSNHKEGNLQRGDVIKLCYESPGGVGEAEEVRLNFIPKIGTNTHTEFTTPDVITTNRVYLYP
ncbi:MAG: archaellin/type IV pilin N-terminal domain-containing protein [Candidatus Nanoarchaeia archaeon]